MENANGIRKLQSELKKALKTIEIQQIRIAELEELERTFDLSILEITEYYQEEINEYQHLHAQPIKVINSFGENETISLSPRYIIAIVTSELNRKKYIYFVEPENSLTIVKKYMLTNKSCFETLAKYFDKLNWHLTRVAQDAVVNIAYYDFNKHNSVVSNNKIELPKQIKRIKIAESLQARKYRKNFDKMKKVKNNKTILEKKIESVREVFSRK